MKGNQITLPTWSWLKVNETDVEIPEIKYRTYELMESSPILPDSKIEDEIISYPHGFSLTEKRHTEEFTNLELYIHAQEGEKLPFKKLNLSLDKNNINLIDKQTIVAEKGSSVEVLYDYNSTDDSKGFRNTALRIVARENSKVKVYLLQRHNENTLSIQSVVSLLYENANVEVIEIEAGASKVFFNQRASLVGDGSLMHTRGAYLTYKKEYLNLFYNFDQIGKKTDASVLIHGALKNESSKMFKATIDFKKGSSGSTGNEEEFVMLLDKDSHSIAVPLLLCHEEDVVGNHASSAGQIDSDILFYIMSRGVDEKEAEKIIVKSKILPIIEELPDEELRDIAWSRLENKLDYQV